MADDIEVGARVRVVEIRDGEIPSDVIGLEGTVEWVTSGYAGDRGYVEVRLDDGRTFQLQTKELELL